MRFKIILEEDEEVGGFIASCPEAYRAIFHREIR
jgi:predicted RNase H-like HicB family nuclease